MKAHIILFVTFLFVLVIFLLKKKWPFEEPEVNKPVINTYPYTAWISGDDLHGKYFPNGY